MEATEKKVSHTPGPWTVNSDFVDGPNTEPICQFCDKFEDSFLNSEANAKLIAAAPELLKALNALVHQVTRDCSISTDPKYFDLLEKVQDALQAIKKATE